MRLAPVAMVLAVAALAGCASPEPFHDEVEDSVAAGTSENHVYELKADGTLTYDLSVLDGKMSVYVMDESEVANFNADGNFEHYQDASREDVASAKKSVNLGAGSYAVVLYCNNVLDPCPYTLKVDITAA